MKISNKKSKILETAIKISQKAGKLIQKKAKQGFKINYKSKFDLVTDADKESEALIIKEIKKIFPSHAILAEEESFKNQKSLKELLETPYIWIIDPIDGTTNYAHNHPHYAISIAVFETQHKETSKNYQYLSGELIAGVINAPALNELFYAEKGSGAFLNKKKIQVSDIPKLENALMVTGFPYKNKSAYLPYFQSMMGKCQGLRRLGSAALDLAYIACGRFDGFWEFGLKPWDIAAGVLIIEEAGGRITDINGNTLDLFGKDILSSNGKIHQEIIKKFEKIQLNN